MSQRRIQAWSLAVCLCTKISTPKTEVSTVFTTHPLMLIQRGLQKGQDELFIFLFHAFIPHTHMSPQLMENGQ